MPLKVKSARGGMRPVDPKQVLFLDVETVPIYPNFEALPEPFQQLWLDKSRKYSYENKPGEELYFEKAGIHAEFGKIVCISVGVYKPNKETGRMSLWIKSYCGEDEKQTLTDFKEMLDKGYYNPETHFLCAHNGIEFDFPYIARRMLINQVPLPALLDVAGSKNWDNRWLIDTMDMWKFGDLKEKSSLNLMAACFGIPSPKDDISGKDVGRVYHEERNLERIKIYCQKDILTLFRLFQCFGMETMIGDEDVVYR